MIPRFFIAPFAHIVIYRRKRGDNKFGGVFGGCMGGRGGGPYLCRHPPEMGPPQKVFSIVPFCTGLEAVSVHTCTVSPPGRVRVASLSSSSALLWQSYRRIKRKNVPPSPIRGFPYRRCTPVLETSKNQLKFHQNSSKTIKIYEEAIKMH